MLISPWPLSVPYEGAVDESLVLEQVDRLMQHQPARLMIADTIGAANPRGGAVNDGKVGKSIWVGAIRLSFPRHPRHGLG